MSENATIAEGTCWVRKSDHFMVEVTEVRKSRVSFIVICPPHSAEQEGEAPVSKFGQDYFLLTPEEAEMREQYEVVEKSVREIAALNGISSYTAYYRLKRLGTDFRKGGVRPNHTYERTERKHRNLEYVRQRLAQNVPVRQIARELDLSESRAFQLAREARQAEPQG